MAEIQTQNTPRDDDARFTSQCNDFLRHYIPLQESKPKDILENRYRIELTVPLPEYNTKNATAFAANDGQDGEKRLLALVCRPNSCQRIKILKDLKNLNHPGILQLIAHGVVQLSQPDAERFVLIYERPEGQKLSEVLATAGNLSEHFLIRNIITPLAQVINALSEVGITHGKINPDNIYYSNKIVLGECASEPRGYSQYFYFEPIELMQAHPAAKGESGEVHDFYALAVLLLYALHGRQHFADFTQQTLMQNILKDGTYYALSRNKENPEIFYDFLRGVLNHNPKDRWGWRHIKSWLDGKHFHVLAPPTPSETVRPFQFRNHIAHSRKELAHQLFQDWVNIPEALHNNQIPQWITVSLRNKPLSETISRIISGMSELGAKNEVQFNEQLMRIILLLDPDGPIRMSPLSLFLDGIDSLAAEYYLNRQEKEFNLLARFIDLNMGNFWLNAQSHEENYEPSINIKTITQKLDRLRICMRNHGLGFGMERILYELNPEMPCLSPLLNGRYTQHFSELLMRLDQLASDLSKNMQPLDRHIFAYLACKLSIQHDIRLIELESLPALAGNSDLIALRLLAIAQSRSNMRLPGLTHWMALRILPSLNCIRSRTVRQQIKKALTDAAESGYTQNMAKVAIDATYANSDYQGYVNAYQSYHQSGAQIISLKKGEHLDLRSNKLGLTIAKVMAYLGFFITLFSILQDSNL